MNAYCRKSLTVTVITAVFAVVSGHAIAAVHGDAGEANLVPLAVWADPTDDLPPVNGSVVDTVVQVIVPSTVGGKTIPNVFTANNTTPNGGPIGSPSISLDETPFAVFLLPPGPAVTLNWRLHWYFLSYRSVELSNGALPITPEDFGHYSLRNLLNGSFENAPGYLLLTTNAGSAGQDANFAFFADAYLTVDNSTSGVAPPGIYSHGAFEIPVLPMSDAADTPATIRPDNQVVEVGAATGPETSPLYSGIPTSWVGATVDGAKKVIDLAVADRAIPDPAIWEGAPPYGASTLMVIWNDRNFAGWDAGRVSFDLFNDFEFGCSGSVRLPNELNLLWMPGLGAAISPPTASNSPSFIRATPVFPNPTASSFYFTGAQCGGADSFVRFQLPLVGNTAPGSAMFAFSMQMWWDGAFIVPRNDLALLPPLANNSEDSDWAAYPSSEAHDRGVFQSAANAFR